MRIPSSLRASRAERWARLRRSLWQPPRAHGEQPRERVVGPLELFYDLAVVVLVAQAAHHLAGHLTWRGLGEFAAVFTLVWIAWANGSLHHELHGHDDARARSTFLLQILLLVAMAAFIPEAGGERGAAFAVAAGVLFAVLAVLWLLAARGDRPQYRRTSGLFVTGTAACAIALAATDSPPNGSGRSSSSCSARPSPAWSADWPPAGQRAHHGRGAGRRRGRLRRLVDLFRLRRTSPAQAGTGAQPAMDTRPSAAYGRCCLLGAAMVSLVDHAQLAEPQLPPHGSCAQGRRRSSSASCSFSCSAFPGVWPSRAAWPAEPIHPAPPRPKGVWF